MKYKKYKKNDLLLHLCLAGILLFASSYKKNAKPSSHYRPIQVRLACSHNVICSNWVQLCDYTSDTVAQNIHFDAVIAAPAITPGILDSGTVLVYGRMYGYSLHFWPKDRVSLLPIVLVRRRGKDTVTDAWSAHPSAGNLQIDFSSSDNSNPSYSHQFRYVIIPGGLKTLGGADPKNYKEFKQALHLPD